MKKYYIILILVIIAGCASDSVSESKKESSLEKKSVANVEANNNVVKVQVPKSRKIASQRSKNRNIKNRKPIQSKKQKNKTNTPKTLDKIKAPDFLLSDLEGNIFDLSAFSGQVIMLTFWGTWCGPCRREIPDFIKLYDEYNDDGLEIVGVAVQSGTPDNIKRFSDYYKINYTILTDIDRNESYRAFHDYGRVTGVGTRAVPTTYLIDRDGYIVKTYRGARPGAVFYQDLQPYL
jgi:peroxiredoxin